MCVFTGISGFCHVLQIMYVPSIGSFLYCTRSRNMREVYKEINVDHR